VNPNENPSQTQDEIQTMTHRTSQLFQFPALLAAAAATLALSACSATEDVPATGENASAVTAAASAGAGARAARRGHRGQHHSPEQLIARFDQNGDGQLQVSELPPRAQERIGKADADGNGVITNDELVKGIQRRMAERFAKTDANGDGKLTQTEVGEQRWSRMSKADADGDGAVTEEELRRAHEQGKLGPRGGGKGHKGGKGPKGGRFFEHADANSDGKLEQSEVPAEIWSHISVADTDKDGAVTQAELRQAHQNGTLKPPPGRGKGQGRRGQGRPGSRPAAQ
jgi:Ca2+-binding EF-hand superfamily protein